MRVRAVVRVIAEAPQLLVDGGDPVLEPPGNVPLALTQQGEHDRIHAPGYRNQKVGVARPLPLMTDTPVAYRSAVKAL